MRALVIVLSFILASITPSVANDAPPNLVGVWKTVSGVGLTGGGDSFKFGEGSSAELEIIKQDGPVFSGVYRWSHPADVDTMDDGEKRTNTAEEAFIGVIDWDNKSLLFVDHPDTTYWFGRLVNAKTIELVVGESGPNAVVSRSLLVR